MVEGSESSPSQQPRTFRMYTLSELEEMFAGLQPRLSPESKGRLRVMTRYLHSHLTVPYAVDTPQNRAALAQIGLEIEQLIHEEDEFKKIRAVFQGFWLLEEDVPPEDIGMFLRAKNIHFGRPRRFDLFIPEPDVIDLRDGLVELMDRQSYELFGEKHMKVESTRRLIENFDRGRLKREIPTKEVRELHTFPVFIAEDANTGERDFTPLLNTVETMFSRKPPNQVINVHILPFGVRNGSLELGRSSPNHKPLNLLYDKGNLNRSLSELTS